MNDMRITMHAGLSAILVWVAAYLEMQSDLFIKDHSFHFMELLASQRLWAVLFLFGANLGIIGLITHRPLLRLISVSILSTTHGIFAGCLILAGPSVWSGTYVIIALMGYSLAFRRVRAGL